MTITVSEEDSLLFEQNGYSYDDVNSTVQHYREIGLSDDEIQNKINLRLNEFKTVPQNKRALENNTNELSYDDPYVQTKEYQQEQLAHLLFTPEELKTIDSQGKMGWVEYRTRFVTPKDYVPGGMLKQGYDSAKLLDISKKIENGEDVSDSDRDFMYKELRKQVELSRRGINWGAKGLSMFIQAPAFMIEFALTGGLGKAATMGAIKAGGAAATKAAIKAGSAIATSKIGAMALGRKAAEKAGTRYSLNVSAEIVGHTAGRQAVLVPAYAYKNYGENRVTDGLNITDKGEIVFSEQKEGQLKTAFQALGASEIDIISESMGGIITGVAGAIGRKAVSTSAARGISAVSAKIYNQLPKSTRLKLEASAQAVQKLTNEKAKAVGFHGVFGEMAEERAADILKVAFDLDAEQDYSVDQWLEAFYPGHEELLLEAGLFSVIGAMSVSTKTVYQKLREQGYEHKEAQNIVNNLSENEKENMANEILGNVPINDDITQEEIDKEAKKIETKLSESGIAQQLKLRLTHNTDAYINNLSNELSNLPEDYADKEYIEYLKSDIDILTKIKNNTLTDVEYEKANTLVNELEAADYTELADELRNISDYEFEDNDAYMQRTENTDDKPIVRKKYNNDTELFDSSNITDNTKTTAIQQPVEVSETKETAADKIIRGESWFGKFYTEWVNRLEPVEALEEKASERKKLSPMQRPNLLARLYSGLVGAVRQQIEKNTFGYNKNGNIQITGEGFLPILNDFDTSFKDVEKNQDKRHTDLKNYLEAQRFLLDLEKRENFEATEEQKLDAIKTMADLAAKYGDRLNDFDKFTDRIYKFQQRILYNLVSSGNMSEESYEKILKDNPHYIPFQRVMDEQFPSVVTPRSKFSGAKANIKGIKGSEREIKDPFESILRNTYDILDRAYRNRVAKSVANLQEVLPEYIEKRKPVYEVGTAKVKVAYDSKLRTKLEKAIKFFGGKLEYKKSLGKGKGLLLGSYSPAENTIRKRLGSQDRTLAHEFGHMLDFVFGVKDVITQNETIMQEISKLAEERFSSVVTLENTAKGVEFVETKEEQSQKYIDYVKSDREMIANMFDLYFTSRDYMKKIAPTAYEFIETLSTEYKFLKDIKPSAETGIEEIEQEVWMPSKAKPYGNVIEYWENGKRKFVEVTKPVMEAINDLSMPELNFVEKLLTASSRVLRTGATIMPDFWVRNILRDQPIAFIQTRNMRPFVDMVKGLCSLIKKDKIYQEWMSSGGSFNSYMDLGDKSMRQAMKELVNPQSKLSQYLKSFGLKAIEDMSMAFEQATRIGIYAREKLNSPALVSAFEAREGTLDFGRAGKAGRRVNRYIPFFNASIQGVDKIVRTFQEHPVITSVKCLTAVTLPSVLLTGYYLYAAPDDDRKEYLDIPQWQRDIFWCFKLGDNWWRIPKPFEIGYVFGSMPERFMTWTYEKELPDGKELWETVGGFFNAVSPITDVGGFMPPALRVAVENITNYNFFTGKSLYPKYLDELEPAERKRKYTSETAQLIGKKLNISPAKIENALSGSIGSSSKYVTDAGDYIINKVREYNGEDINEKPSSLNDIPVLRSFVLREPQGFQTKSVNDFFDIYKKTKEKHNTYKKKTGEERRNYYEKNKLQIKAFKRMDNYYKEIKGLSKRADKIYENKNLTGDEKAGRIKPLASKISAAAFEANIWYKEYKEQEK